MSSGLATFSANVTRLANSNNMTRRIECLAAASNPAYVLSGDRVEVAEFFVHDYGHDDGRYWDEYLVVVVCDVQSAAGRATWLLDGHRPAGQQARSGEKPFTANADKAGMVRDEASGTALVVMETPTF